MFLPVPQLVTVWFTYCYKFYLFNLFFPVHSTSFHLEPIQLHFFPVFSQHKLTYDEELIRYLLVILGIVISLMWPSHGWSGIRHQESIPCEKHPLNTHPHHHLRLKTATKHTSTSSPHDENSNKMHIYIITSLWKQEQNTHPHHLRMKTAMKHTSTSSPHDENNNKNTHPNHHLRMKTAIKTHIRLIASQWKQQLKHTSTSSP